MKATNTWHSTPRGLVLKIEVEIEGRTLVSQSVISNTERIYGTPPFDYIERHMQQQIMDTLRQELFPNG